MASETTTEIINALLAAGVIEDRGGRVELAETIIRRKLETAERTE